MSAFEDKIDIEGLSTSINTTPDKPMTAGDYQDQLKQAKTWKILKQQHSCYPTRALDVKKQNLLYAGGFQMNTPEIASLFCPKLKSDEDDTVFAERVASAAYVPTFSKLITGLISNLFSQDLAVMEAADHDDASTLGDEMTDNLRDFYKKFHNDCDGHGTTLHDFIRLETTEALIHSFHYFGVDYPKGEATNLLEQERLGLDQPHLYTIQSQSVYDWKLDESNPHAFLWLKIVNCLPVQPTPFDPPMHQYEVKTWSMTPDGFAAYQIYQSQPLPLDKEPKDKDLLLKIDEGITSFHCIPIFYFCLDEGVAVGPKLAPMAAEHFNRTTIENHYTHKACLTIPVVYRGDMMPEGNGLPDPIVTNTNRGQHPRGKINSKGVVELGSWTQDRFEIVEAVGTALSFIHQQNEDLDEKMHSVVNQMGQSLKQASTNSGRSGLSKQEDRHSTEMLLTTIADEVYAITERIFTVIAESRGEDIVWDVKGLSSITTEDRTELIQEALTLSNINIPSLTFLKEYHYRLASRLVDGTDQRTLQTIRAEIQQGLEEKTTSDGYQLPPTNDA